LIAGVDEVGWGSLAGPIISVCAVFKEEDLLRFPKMVDDSKKLSKNRREYLFPILRDLMTDVGIGWAHAWEVDQLTPRIALALCHDRALMDLTLFPDRLTVDGTNKVNVWRGPQRVEPKADTKYKEVSAASIYAKVFRDQIMSDYHERFPEYRWDVNSGYESPEHAEAIRKHGLVIKDGDRLNYVHRKSYTRKFIGKVPGRE
jgi:ribonuclease HII